MPIYEFYCDKCGNCFEIYKPVSRYKEDEKCECGSLMKRVISSINVLGSRDSFGVGKSFFCQTTGKTIDNWNSWEKAGYKDALSCVKPNIKERVKEKIKKIKRQKEK